MINGFFLPAIKLVEEAIFLNKCNEVCIYLVLDFSLAFFDRFLVLLAKVFVGLEPLPDFLRLFTQRFLSKFVQVTVFLDKIWILVHFIHDNVK